MVYCFRETGRESMQFLGLGFDRSIYLCWALERVRFFMVRIGIIV